MLNNLNRRNREWTVQWYNISKLKIYRQNAIDNDEIITDLENFKWDDLAEVIEQNKQVIYDTITLCAGTENEWKEKFLKKYINTFLSNMTLQEESEFETKLLYYIEKFKDDFFASLKESKSPQYNEIIEKFDNIHYSKKKDLLFELLFNSILLPEYTNQKEFNSIMDKVLFRFELKLNELIHKQPIVIEPIDARQVYLYMQETGRFYIKSNILTEWIIDKISCNISMEEMDSEIEDPVDEFSFTLHFNTSIDQHINQYTIKQLLDSLDDEITRVWEDSYLIWKSAQLNYMLYISDPIIDWWIMETWDVMTHEIKIYATPHGYLKPKDFLSVWCKELPAVVEDFTSMLYNVFWRLPSRDWTPWKDIIPWAYPSVPQVFDVMEYFNDEDDYEWGLEGMTLTWKQPGSNSDKFEFFVNPKTDLGFDDLILEDIEKETIVEIIDVFQDFAYYSENWWDMPTWIIFEWQPGWGKTLSAKIIAKESWSAIIVAKWNMQDAEVGQSEKNVQSVFDKAKKYVDETWENVMIFFDEADTLFSKRGWSVKDFKEWMFSVLAQEMDWFNETYKWKIFVIFATNRTEILDDAVKSRSNKIVEFKMPNLENRIKHLKLNMNIKQEKASFDVYSDDIDFEKISEKIDWKSGRFIKNLISNVHNKFLRLRKKDSNIPLVDTKFIMDMVEVTQEQETKTSAVMWFQV